MTTLEDSALQTATPASTDAKRLFRSAEKLINEVPFREELEFLRDAARALKAQMPASGVTWAIAEAEGGSFAIREQSIPSDPSAPERFAKHGALLRREGALDEFDGDSEHVFWLLRGRFEWSLAWRIPRVLADRESMLLGAARLVLSQRLAEHAFAGVVRQAAAIQQSLLPRSLATLPGFDLAARSIPAETVGGDVYDVLTLGPDVLGLAIADAAGHGLPAALEARDIVVGLRLCASRDQKIGATVERLNEVICRAALPSRFVSLVYGELSQDGDFLFVNAGHPRPLLLNPATSAPSFESGVVLGVSRQARYRQQQGVIEPGGVLVLVTDGVLERRSPQGEEFGFRRLEFLARALSDRPAGWIVSAIFEALAEHAGSPVGEDDATVVVVRRLHPLQSV